MESTGKYWHPVYNVPELTCNVVLAHPKHLKAIRGKKTDQKDAKWIADIFKHDLVSGSFIPPADIRQLRDLMRYRSKLTNFATGEKNRAQNCLTTSNVQLDHAFSDVFGKSATAILDYMLEHPDKKGFDVTPFVDRRCKTPIEEIRLSIDGAISREQAEKLKVIRAHMDNLELCKANLSTLRGLTFYRRAISYAHHISGARSVIISSRRVLTAFSTPSRMDIMASSCSRLKTLS